MPFSTCLFSLLSRRMSMAVAASIATLGAPAVTVTGCGSGTGGATAGSDCATTFDTIVAMSDYDSSACGAITADARAAPLFKAGPDLGKDPQLVTSRGRTFFIARDRDEVFELRSACGAPFAKYSTADSSHVGTTNPQDVAVAPDGALWVARLGVPSIAVIGIDGKPRGSIDISKTPKGPTDADGNPNASAIRIVDVAGKPKAFVALERLDDNDLLKSKQDSAMVRIDVESMTVEDDVALVGRDPFNPMTEHEGALFLAAVGERRFDADDDLNGGIERFDPASFTSRLLVPERALGGTLTAVAITHGCGAAIVVEPTTDVNATGLVTFDPDSGAVVTALATSPLKTDGFDLLAIAWKGDVLLVGDKRRAPAGYPIHAFQRGGGGCVLTPLPDRIFVAQKPIVLRTPE